MAVYEGEFAGALFGAVSGLLWDYTAGRTVGMLALELMLLCFGAFGARSGVSAGQHIELCAHQHRHGPCGALGGLAVLLLYARLSWALSRWLTFVLPSAMMTLVPSLMLFSLVRHIYRAFKIDNGVV